MEPVEADNRRILIHAPIGRDGSASAELLTRAGLAARVCADIAELTRALDAGAGAAFIAEEGLFGQGVALLEQWVGSQPAWSDLPFVILTSRHDQAPVVAWRQRLVQALRNVSMLERPVRPITLTSAMQSALRARTRQYEVRALIEARDRAAQELETLVAARTRELADANAELVKQMAEREKFEAVLRQSQKIEAIGRLTGGVAHDFNNLLMVISGGLSMLERPQAPDRRQRIVDGMRNAAERGAGLSKQLLAFARRRPLTAQSVDLADQIERMRELLDRALRGDVHVETWFADGLWPANVDPAELELVVLNLCVNARDAMPNGGTITIRAENAPGIVEDGLSGDFVRLSVIDTGTGMPPEVRDKVFEPFFTTKEIGQGSGLGLPQVYGFAQQSGGAVQLDTEVGEGTRISLLLPRSSDVPARIEPAPASGERPARRSSGDVLLVEDDDEVAALVAEMLGQLGWTVTRVASAAAALGALADSRAIDLVFSDVMMPGGMNGVDLAREIRRRRPQLPVVLTSGYAEAAAKDAEAAGIALLPKPYVLDDLDRRLCAVLAESKARRAI